MSQGKSIAHDRPIDRPIPIPMEDRPIHSADYPFCPDWTCPCHEDAEQVARVNGHYQDGLLTSDEATNITKGGTWRWPCL